MRKEIGGIFLFFFVLFLLVSLLSYSHMDLSSTVVEGPDNIRNTFGLIGAYTSGSLFHVFGLGAYWIPLLALFSFFRFLRNMTWSSVVLTFIGGVLLVVSTATLLGLWKADFMIFNSRVPSGGLVGFEVARFLVKYSNVVGAVLILSFFLIIGFILSTGFSLADVAGRVGLFLVSTVSEMKRRITVKLHEMKGGELKVESEAVERDVNIFEPDMDTFTDATSSMDIPASKKKLKKKKKAAAPSKDGREVGLPPLELLDESVSANGNGAGAHLKIQSQLLEQKLEHFGVKGRVTAVLPGPVITTFEFEPAPGVKINKIVNLSDDLALALRAISVRIIAPIPGKAAVGIEIPNPKRELVRLRDIVGSKAFEKSRSKLTIALGKDITGSPVTAELEKMPHLLIAGATGMGKSVGLNSMISSLLFKSMPDEVKLLMIDPKKIELAIYDGIPHLIAPVVTDVKKATNSLFWAIREMEKRYELLAKYKVKNIDRFNRKVEAQRKAGEKKVPDNLPYVVIIIDELADLMMVATKDVETALTRLAQMARAAGIHLILATQRPSVNVLTGVIKANFPTRLSFKTASKTDSRTILDANGAETLLGNGDMLFLPPGTSIPLRIHGSYISEDELNRLTDHLKDVSGPDYNTEVVGGASPKIKIDDKAANRKEYDERYDEAVALVTKTKQASVSMIRRQLGIGYNRASKILDVMEQEGIISSSKGDKPREVLVRGYEDMP